MVRRIASGVVLFIVFASATGQQAVQPPPGHVFIQAGRCKIALLASAPRQPDEAEVWEGPCVYGLANGEGLWKSYRGAQLEVIRRVAFERGVNTQVHDQYLRYDENTVVHRSNRHRGEIRVQPSQIPAWAGEIVGQSATSSNPATGSTPARKVERRTIRWSDGSRYEGEVTDGKITGKGTMDWPDGTRYVGEFVDSNKHGKGVLTHANGRIAQDGEFKNGEFWEGTVHDMYGGLTGHYSQGRFTRAERKPPQTATSGRGSLSWPNGARYEGDLVNGVMHGRGRLVWPDGSRYEGEFLSGVRTGEGMLHFPNGARYEGRFVNNKRMGEGVMYFPNGNRFEGRVIDDKFYKGDEFNARGERIAEWNDGHRVAAAPPPQKPSAAASAPLPPVASAQPPSTVTTAPRPQVASPPSEPDAEEDDDEDKDKQPSSAQIWGQAIGDALRQREERRRQGRTGTQDRPSTGQGRPTQVASIPRPAGPTGAALGGGGQSGLPMRAAVAMVFDPIPGAYFQTRSGPIYMYVAGRGEAELESNARYLAEAFRAKGTFSLGPVASATLEQKCAGPGLLVEARISWFVNHTAYGAQMAGCVDGTAADMVRQIRTKQDGLVREASDNWSYYYFRIGYMDGQNFRSGHQYASVIQEMEAGGRRIGLESTHALVLADTYRTVCDVERDKKLFNLEGCLRSAIETFKARGVMR